MLKGEGRIGPATHRILNTDQPRRGQPQEAAQTYRNKTKTRDTLVRHTSNPTINQEASPRHGAVLARLNGRLVVAGLPVPTDDLVSVAGGPS